MRSAFVSDKIWGFMLEPARIRYIYLVPGQPYVACLRTTGSLTRVRGMLSFFMSVLTVLVLRAPLASHVAYDAYMG